VAGFYANITVSGPPQDEIVSLLRQGGVVAYVSPTVKSSTVIFHEDLAAQESIASALSSHFGCPALVVMDYGGSVLLYQLYVAGEQVDAYVSRPHDELDTAGEPTPEGDASKLCRAFGMDYRASSVERVLRREGKPESDYALAVNRHGELARALGLPLFAAGTGYGDIEVGELPVGQGFQAGAMTKTISML
jgi:hypothetical protein